MFVLLGKVFESRKLRARFQAHAIPFNGISISVYVAIYRVYRRCAKRTILEHNTQWKKLSIGYTFSILKPQIKIPYEFNA